MSDNNPKKHHYLTNEFGMFELEEDPACGWFTFDETGKALPLNSSIVYTNSDGTHMTHMTISSEDKPLDQVGIFKLEP